MRLSAPLDATITPFNRVHGGSTSRVAILSAELTALQHRGGPPR
ncbi:MAG: hypothetical protein AAF791_10920 [Bacteroidota bacterium]